MAAKVVRDNSVEDGMWWVVMDDMLADKSAATQHNDE
jgi:hypothetical protein